MTLQEVARRQAIVPPAGRDVLSYAIAPNSKDVFLLAEDAGHVKLYQASARGGEARLAFDMQLGLYNSLSGADRAGRPVLIGTFESAVNPPAVVRIDVSRRAHLPLTKIAAERAAALDLAPVEHFWFDSKRGRRIHNMVVRPPGFDPSRKYPLFVLMHGGPHMMWRDSFFLRWNYHLLAAPGYVVLLTNYSGSTGFGEAFAQASRATSSRDRPMRSTRRRTRRSHATHSSMASGNAPAVRDTAVTWRTGCRAARSATAA